MMVPSITHLSDILIINPDIHSKMFAGINQSLPGRLDRNPGRKAQKAGLRPGPRKKSLPARQSKLACLST
jgi:hypothetical protein